MVGKEKETARKGRSAGLKMDDKTETVKPRTASRGRDKSPHRRGTASGDKVRSRTRKTDVSPTKPAKPKAEKPEPKKTPRTPRKAAPSSPSRKASPSRTTLRPRSPARKERVNKQEKGVIEEKRTQVINISDSESDSDTTATSSIRTRSKRTLSKEPSVEHNLTLRSRVRLDNAELFRPMNSAYEPIQRPKVTEFSDEDVDVAMEQPSPMVLSKTARFAGFVSLLATLAYCLTELLLTYLIPLLCNEQQCAFRFLQRKDIEHVLTSFDPAIFFSFTAFFLFNGILSIIPIGGRKYASHATRDSDFEYILNGLFALGVQIAILVALEVYHIPITAHIINNFFSLLTCAVVLSFALGLILLVKSFYIRREQLVEKDQGVLSSFILGAELNPRFGPMDIKFVIVRICLIGAVLLCLSYVYQSMEMIAIPPPSAEESLTTNWFTLIQSVRIRPTLFVLTTLIVLYFGDQLVFEQCQMSMMEFKNVSWGFLKCNEYMAGLFVYCAVPKYVYDYDVKLESWQLGVCTLLFIMGYVLYRGANSQKHAFRENPYGLLVAKYESIPTTTGKKILCSGYWGFVRHPNYLGDIMLNLSMIPFVWPTPLLLLFVFITSHLVLRAYVDNKKCSKRYGVAWNRYCQRVPYLILPKVF